MFVSGESADPVADSPEVTQLKEFLAGVQEVRVFRKHLEGGAAATKLQSQQQAQEDKQSAKQLKEKKEEALDTKDKLKLTAEEWKKKLDKELIDFGRKIGSLQTLYFLRRTDGAASEAVILKALGHDDPRAVILALDAVRFAYALYPDLRTAAYDALLQGLRFDSNTELIVYLSDGKPTTGSIVDPEGIVENITTHNLFQRTTIDTLGIDTHDEFEKFMQDLADQNYGHYFKLRW